MITLIVNDKIDLNILSTKYGFEYNSVGSIKDNMECYIKDCENYSVRVYTAGFVMIKDKLNNDWYEDYDVLINFKEIKELFNNGILIKEKWEDN